MPNATIPRGITCYTQNTGQAVIFSKDIRVRAKIIPDDISVTEFKYKGVWYTVDTSQVIWD